MTDKITCLGCGDSSTILLKQRNIYACTSCGVLQTGDVLLNSAHIRQMDNNTLRNLLFALLKRCATELAMLHLPNTYYTLDDYIEDARLNYKVSSHLIEELESRKLLQSTLSLISSTWHSHSYKQYDTLFPDEPSAEQ